MVPVLALVAATAAGPLLLGKGEGAACVGACDGALTCVLGKCRQSEDPCKADCEDPAKMGCAMCCWAANLDTWKCGNDKEDSEKAPCCLAWDADCYTTDNTKSFSHACRQKARAVKPIHVPALRKAGAQQVACTLCASDTVLDTTTDTQDLCRFDCWLSAGQGGSTRCTHAIWNAGTKRCLGWAKCDVCASTAGTDVMMEVERPSYNDVFLIVQGITEVAGVVVSSATVEQSIDPDFIITLKLASEVTDADLLQAVGNAINVPVEVLHGLVGVVDDVTSGFNNTNTTARHGQVLQQGEYSVTVECCAPPSLVITASGLTVSSAHVPIPIPEDVEWLPGLTLHRLPRKLGGSKKFVFGESSDISPGTTILVECKTVICDVQIHLYKITSEDNGGLSNALIPGTLEAAGWQCGSCAPDFKALSQTGQTGCSYKMAAYRRIIERGEVEIQLDQAEKADFVIAFGEAAANCALRTTPTSCEASNGATLDYCSWVAGTGCVDNWCGKMGVPCSDVTNAPVPINSPPTSGGGGGQQCSFPAPVASQPPQ